MKTRIVAVMLALTLIGFGVVAVRPEAAVQSQSKTEKKMSSKELKQLIQNAHTPADHQRIASYYRQEAQDLRARAVEHRDLAEAYANKTTYEPPKGEWLQHCRNFAASFDSAAKEADALAALHTKMAKNPGK